MKFAACFTLVFALASLPAAADDKAHSSIAKALVNKAIDNSGARKSDAPDKTDPPAPPNIGNRPPDHRSPHSVAWGDSGDSLRIASCPMDSAGAPTFEEVRNHFREFTDNEMWKICVNRDTYRGVIRGACACSLLAYPTPWRPVDTPHQLENADEPLTDPAKSDSGN